MPTRSLTLAGNSSVSPAWTHDLGSDAGDGQERPPRTLRVRELCRPARSLPAADRHVILELALRNRALVLLAAAAGLPGAGPLVSAWHLPDRRRARHHRRAGAGEYRGPGARRGGVGKARYPARSRSSSAGLPGSLRRCARSPKFGLCRRSRCNSPTAPTSIARGSSSRSGLQNARASNCRRAPSPKLAPDQHRSRRNLSTTTCSTRCAAIVQAGRASWTQLCRAQRDPGIHHRRCSPFPASAEINGTRRVREAVRHPAQAGGARGRRHDVQRTRRDSSRRTSRTRAAASSAGAASNSPFRAVSRVRQRSRTSQSLPLKFGAGVKPLLVQGRRRK